MITLKNMKTININGQDYTVEELTTILENAKKQKQTPLQELLDYHNLTEEEFNKLSGFEKECRVVAFYNKGWKPDWEDSKEIKHLPYFYMNTFRLNIILRHYSASMCSTHLCFKNEEDVREAVEKYFEIFKQSRTEI